jgi:hypothetical protein
MRLNLGFYAFARLNFLTPRRAGGPSVQFAIHHVGAAAAVENGEMGEQWCVFVCAGNENWKTFLCDKF